MILLALARKIEYKNKDILVYIKTNMEQLLQEYLASLNEKEKKAYEIARDHLGTSFQLEKSNGFLKWKKERDNTPTK
jgi:hypothetical protein